MSTLRATARRSAPPDLEARIRSGIRANATLRLGKNDRDYALGNRFFTERMVVSNADFSVLPVFLRKILGKLPFGGPFRRH